MKRETDWLAVVAQTFIAVVLIGVLASLWDEIQNYRAFDARVACEQQRMIPRRKPMEVTVTCVPIPTRQDTTTFRTPDIRP
ncbi:MAG: hypothetical protein NUW01_16775 [Gemmatimonadaceae bacterium]|nr:hypothetical protein [Gemmatimonadaceae bacterium]